MKKRNLKPVSIQEHLAEILRLANLKQYIIHTELKLQQARLICEMLEKTAVLTNKENQN